MTTHSLTDADRKEIHDAFTKLVNMTPSALRRWLQSEESRSVGMTSQGERVTAPGQQDSVGHHMGERILQIRDTRQADLTEDD